MVVVSKEVKAMSQKDILAFEKAGEVTIATHCLKLTDIKVHLVITVLMYSTIFIVIDPLSFM